MESLFFVVCIAYVLYILSLLAFIVGAIMLIYRIVKNSKAVERKSILVPLGLTIGGCLIFLAINIASGKVTNLFEQDMSQLRQKYDEAVCLEASVAEGYKLQIVSFRDGTYEAGLEKFDGSQSYIYGITEFVIISDHMIGIVGPQEAPNYWFWFNFKTGRSRNFEDKLEFVSSLPVIGLAEEPILLPISVYCERESCYPCRTPPPSQDDGLEP